MIENFDYTIEKINRIDSDIELKIEYRNIEKFHYKIIVSNLNPKADLWAADVYQTSDSNAQPPERIFTTSEKRFDYVVWDALHSLNTMLLRKYRKERYRNELLEYKRRKRREQEKTRSPDV